MTCCQVRISTIGAGATGDLEKINDADLFSSRIDSRISLCVTVCVCYPAGTHFRRIIPDDGPATVDPQKVKRVVFCTGKVYYELVRERKNRGMDETVAVVRIEQVTDMTDICRLPKMSHRGRCSRFCVLKMCLEENCYDLNSK